MVMRAVHHTLLPVLQWNPTKNRKRVLLLLLATTCLIAIFGLAAQAGQGPSQWCSDGGGMEEHIIDSPATFNVEAGGPVGPSGNSWIVCASPTAWGDGTPAPTGGAAWFGTTQGTTGGNNWVGCGSDNNSSVLAFGCNDQVGTNLSNPLSPSAGVTYSNWVNVAGMVGAQTGCEYGYTAGTGGVGCVPGGPATRPSEWCSDNQNSSEVHIANWPATFNLEPGSSFANPNYLMTCYSTTSYRSGDTEATGGSASLNTPTQNGASMGCWSDPGAIARLDCGNGIGLNTSNPTDPRANASSYANGANVAGNQVSAPSVGAGTDCNSGTVAVSVYSCANGGVIGISGSGGASGGTLAASGTGCAGGNTPDAGVAVSGTNCAYGALAGASGTGSTGGRIAASGAGCSWGWYVGVNAQGCAYSTLLAISATGPATAYGNSTELGGTLNGFGISGTGDAYGWFLGASGTGYASGVNAISGTGNSYANTYQLYPSVYLGNSISGTGSATGVIAVGGNGCSTGWYVGVNAQGCAYSTLLAISGTGPATAYGNSQNLVVAGTVIPNGYGISGTGDAYGWLLGVSGTRNASGVNAVSGTGDSYGSGYQIYPGISEGIAVSGAGNATGKDIAISGTNAGGTDPEDNASLLTANGAEVFVGDVLVYLNTGILTAPITQGQILDQSYVPDPVRVALKEESLQEMMPEVVNNMITGITGTGNMSASNANTPSLTSPNYAGGPTPKNYRLNPSMQSQQTKYWCAPAVVRSILADFGVGFSQQYVAGFLNTDEHGTTTKSVNKVLNMPQDDDEFYRKMPSDAVYLMGMANYDIYRVRHSFYLSVDPGLLPYSQGKIGAGFHAISVFGYYTGDRDNPASLDVFDPWNPQDLHYRRKWIQRNGNPYGPHYNQDIHKIYSAIQEYNGDNGGAVW
jgi:hypothetical protein